MDFKKVYTFADDIYIEENQNDYRVILPSSLDLDQRTILKSAGAKYYETEGISYYEFAKNNEISITMIDQMLGLDEVNDSIKKKFTKAAVQQPKVPSPQQIKTSIQEQKVSSQDVKVSSQDVKASIQEQKVSSQEQKVSSQDIKVSESSDKKETNMEDAFINSNFEQKFRGLEEKLPSDNYTIDTSIPFGQYPREIYRDKKRGILINDYSEKTFSVFFTNWQFENEWFKEKYQCKSSDILGEKKKFKIDYNNELRREYGFNIPKSIAGNPIIKSKPLTRLDVIFELAGINPLELCTKTTSTYTPYNNNYSQKPVNSETMSQVTENFGSMTTFSFIPPEPQGSLLSRFPEKKRLSDLYEEILKLSQIGTGDVQEESMPPCQGFKRFLIYGKINIVDSKFAQMDDRKVAKESELIIDNDDENERTKIISYFVIN